MGSRFNPTMGRTCPQCAQGTEWRSPSGSSIWLCGEHERIVARQEGWVKVPRGISQDDPPYGVFGTGTELAARQALDLNQHITVRLMVKLSDEDRADLLAAVQRVVDDWAPDVTAVANWENEPALSVSSEENQP